MTEDRNPEAFRISSFPHTLGAARRIVSLASTHSDAPEIAAAALTTAAALEQYCQFTLEGRCDDEARTGHCHRDATPTGRFLQRGPSFLDRLLRAAEIATDEKSSLNRRSVAFGRLKDLISRRNKLLHIEERAIPISKFDTVVSEDPNGDMHVRIRFLTKPEDWPVNPWTSVTPAQCLAYLAAVDDLQAAIAEPEGSPMLIRR